MNMCMVKEGGGEGGKEEEEEEEKEEKREDGKSWRCRPLVSVHCTLPMIAWDWYGYIYCIL